MPMRSTRRARSSKTGASTATRLRHLEAAAAGLRPEKDYIHYQLQAAYRKLNRSADADRELEIYKALKAKSREHIADALKHTP